MSQLPDQYNEDYFTTKYGKKSSDNKFEVLNPKKTKKINEFVVNQVSQLNIGKDNVLEIGCGYGILLKTFQNTFQHLYGTDISEHAIEYAKNNLNAELISHDIQKSIPFDKKFDVILAIDVLEHLNELDVGIENIKSMMNEQSILIIEMPLYTGSWYNKQLWKMIFDKDPTHVVRKNFDEINAKMNEHGIQCIYRGTVFEIPFITKITKKRIFEKYTGQHFGLYKCI